MKKSKVLRCLVRVYQVYRLYNKFKNIRKTTLKRRRRWWVRPINLDRDRFGYFERMFKKMKDLDEEEFFAQTRMTKEVYNLLLSLIEGDLQKRSIRQPIKPECRLALTLS